MPTTRPTNTASTRENSSHAEPDCAQVQASAGEDHSAAMTHTTSRERARGMLQKAATAIPLQMPDLRGFDGPGSDRFVSRSTDFAGVYRYVLLPATTRSGATRLVRGQTRSRAGARGERPEAAGAL